MSDKGDQFKETSSEKDGNSTCSKCEKDGNATCSEFTYHNPEKISHNTRDLRVFDYNSADDVRQALKGAFTDSHADVETTITPIGVGDQHVQAKSEISLHIDSNQPKNFFPKQTQTASFGFTTQRYFPDIDLKHEEGINFSCSKTVRSISGKRPGRPPKAGPSKKIKRVTVTQLYKGKLSNLMPEKCRSNSDSDSDSLIFD